MSSAVVLSPWASVAPQAKTSAGRSSLPKKYRAASMVWQPMSSSAPPPAASASQKWGAWGPECASRARTVRTRPMAPASIISRARMTLGLNTSVSA